jgi:RimJ/RimL family protein N-acetyltransferase
MKTHRIFATCRPANIPSVRALEKSGMAREALLKENILIRGKWEDSLLFAILDHEWRL